MQNMHAEYRQEASRNGLKNLILYLLLAFPIASILKVYLGPLNRILTGMVFVLFFAYYLRNGIVRKELVVLVYSVLTLIQNILLWGTDYYEANMLFYFPFLLMYFFFFIRNTDYIFRFMREKRGYIDGVLLLWSVIILISFLVPSCYVYEGESRGFVSFAGSTFLLCPISIFVFALLSFQYYLYRKKIYLVALIIPSLCVLMGTTRTYLAVLLGAWLVFLYITQKKQKYFVPIMVTGSILFFLVVLISPISQKFVDVLGRTESWGMDFLAAFSSGRSVFWMYDVNAIFQNGPWRVLLGNGVNWLFYLNEAKFNNPLWAHNDFIQIVSDYGLLGMGMYFWCFWHLFRHFLKDKGVSVMVILILVVMWSFNAFFNMFYTYFCAVLSFPFFLLLVGLDAEVREESVAFANASEKDMEEI